MDKDVERVFYIYTYLCVAFIAWLESYDIFLGIWLAGAFLVLAIRRQRSKCHHGVVGAQIRTARCSECEQERNEFIRQLVKEAKPIEESDKD